MAQCKEKGNMYCWTDHETAELIRIWGDQTIQSLLNNSRNNSIIFQLISDGLKERGIDRSAEQCRSKIKYLKKEYMKKRKALASSEDKETFSQSCKFFEQFDEILEKQATTSSTHFSDSLEPEELMRNLLEGNITATQPSYNVVEALVEDADLTYESSIKDATQPSKRGKRKNTSLKKGSRKRAIENRRMTNILRGIEQRVMEFQVQRDDQIMAFLREERENAEQAIKEITEREEQLMHLILGPLNNG